MNAFEGEVWKRSFMSLGIRLICISMTGNLQLNAIKKVMRIKILTMMLEDKEQLKKPWLHNQKI